MNRKERLRRNLGGTFDEGVKPYFDGPPLAEARTSIVLSERLLLQVLRQEIERLMANQTELTRFFSHFFDPTAGVERRDEFVQDFMRRPPLAILGYPRINGEFPCFAIVLESEEETDPGIIGKYVGATLDGESAAEEAEYLGAFFSQTFGVYVYAEHPDVCSYLYQFAKLCLFAAKGALEGAGLLDLHFSGNDLAPQDYQPENMFGRVLHVSCKTMMTIPQLFSFKDSTKLRVTGVFRDDVVVDGVRGGVHAYSANEDDDDAEE